MAGLKRVGDLDIGGDMRHHRRAWVVKRCAWVVIVLILLSALAGVFGRGPVSHAMVQDASGQLRVKFERFARYHSPEDITIYYSSPGLDEARIEIDRAFLEAVEIKKINPEPIKMEAAGERITLVIGQQKNSPSNQVIIRLEPNKFGWNSGSIRLGNAAVEMKQFYFP